MANDGRRVSDLPVSVAVSATDRLLVVTDPTGTPVVKTVPVANLIANSALTPASPLVPATSTSNGTPGAISYSSDYLYVCVANNSWKRASLSSW